MLCLSQVEVLCTEAKPPNPLLKNTPKEPTYMGLNSLLNPKTPNLVVRHPAASSYQAFKRDFLLFHQLLARKMGGIRNAEHAPRQAGVFTTLAPSMRSPSVRKGAEVLGGAGGGRQSRTTTSSQRRAGRPRSLRWYQAYRLPVGSFVLACVLGAAVCS